MTDDEGRSPVYRVSREVRPGQPIQVSEPLAGDASELSPLCAAMVESLRAYRKAGRELVEGQYASVRELAPPHLRVPCHIYVVCCPDGVIVRYDAAGEEEPKVRGSCPDRHESLAEMAPAFSEHVIHVSDDPETYVPKHEGPGFILVRRDEHGEEVEFARFHPMICAPKTLPADFKLPLPPARPPCLASFHRELQFHMHGVLSPANTPARAISTGSDHFLAHGLMSLPVGWQAIEIYPRLGEEYWRPEYAAAWAQLDLLNAIAQHNLVENALHRLDGRRAAREQATRLLAEFEALLAGPEEPCHQFLKTHPDLLCTTYDAAWSKVPFGKGVGKRVSDFVFREPCNNYLLVEIEAPHLELFRKDGHQRQELTHAIGQIDDWLCYIQDNKAKVESELELHGISATPRSLVVIGRSATLTEGNRRKLAVMQGRHPGLSIITYDELIDRARANFERHFGPLSLRAENLDIYYYRHDPAATT
jgi:Domain of unknown function (DUF4263)